MTQDGADNGTPLISDGDATYLRNHLPDHTFDELLAFLEQLPEDLRPVFVTLVRREAEPMGEGALPLAMSRLYDATNPLGERP